MKEGGKTTLIWKPAAGLSNIGLLVKTWGRVTKIIDGAVPSIMISDGSSSGVRVLLKASIPAQTVGTIVVVTGISSIVVDDDGRKVRAVKVRGDGDMAYPRE